MRQKRILLMEPGYRNKYPPLGLDEARGLPQGARGLREVHQGRALQKRRSDVTPQGPVGPGLRDDAVQLRVENGPPTPSTRQSRSQRCNPSAYSSGGSRPHSCTTSIRTNPRWAGVRFIKGLLVGPPATALKLSAADCDFGADDLHGRPIEERTPDYEILSDTRYTYPVRDAYFGYASRGCVRKCAFCGVPKLEGPQREMPPLTELVGGIEAAHGTKKDLVLMDNNITASARYKEVIAEIRDLGFEQGAKLTRPGCRPVKRRVDFNQGIDARILAKSPMYLREMATICISPLRIAFDHIGMRKVYETAIRMAADNAITSLSNYMLYNFMDTPSDLYERMQLNIALNEELNIRIWSFPMRYQPVTLKDRSHVGKNWNRYYLRSFQLMLQATHGLVSGNPAFFHRAYGEDRNAFERLLSEPQRVHLSSGTLRARRRTTQYATITRCCGANSRRVRSKS